MEDTLSILLDSSTIQKKVQELGAKISNDYCVDGVDDVVVICVMKGAFLFFADLVRCIDLPKVCCEFIGVSSYEGTSSTGNVKLSYGLDSTQVEGRNILIVEDIYDTGNTLKFLLEHLKSCNPKNVKVCCLLAKQGNAVHNVPIDYIGFIIDKNAFVIGYGLDYNGLYRNLPYIGVLKEEDE